MSVTPGPAAPAYFPVRRSIARSAEGRIEPVLAAVANRYIGANPAEPPVYRVHLEDSFRRLADCRYDMNLQQRLPGLEEGEFVYVWGKLWSEAAADIPLAINCYGPAAVYVNGCSVFQSNLNEDVFPERKAFFRAGLDVGWNHVLLEFTAVATGCGGIFGTGSVKGAPLHFLAPTAQRSGCEGWIYSVPQPARWPLSSEWSAAAAEAELEMRCTWLPQAEWSAVQLCQGNLARVCGDVPGAKAFAWSRLAIGASGGTELRLRASSRGTSAFAVYVDGHLAGAQPEGNGILDLELQLAFGYHDLVVEAVCGGADWGFEVEAVAGAEALPAGSLQAPYPVEGLGDSWLYLGPFAGDEAPPADAVAAPDTLFGEGEERRFWRSDRPGGAVRPYLETALYGRWNYPLGVTLYGLLRTGEALEESVYSRYAAGHIGQCTRLHEYALWDKAHYGAPGINHQLAMIDSLDDCGSFGAAMLTAHLKDPLRGAVQAAEHIARYICTKQARTAEGALYRTEGTTDFMQDTMWCDDLYMSTPFLCRYYELTGDSAYLDDAANQFLQYRKLLFRAELGIMDHVYDFKFGKRSGVAWGRGNGWVLFSLTELLEAMPQEHPLRPELLVFFQALCAGYSRLQDRLGLWHQVLNDPESYAEASCSSMFIYAFARGVRRGWLTEPQPYIASALRGWTALAEYCIDRQGNVYGVCRGSGYSFNKLYYKEQLTWQLNDTHGIGIVLLAGIEALELTRELERG